MSLLDIIPGGAYLESAVSSATTKAGFAADKVSGTVGKAYNGTLSAVYGAVGSTAQVAQNVATGVRNYATYAVLGIGLFLLWPIVLPLIEETVTSFLNKRSA